MVLCVGTSPVSGEFPSQRPVTRGFETFFDLRLNKRLCKQTRHRWFETLSRSLWCHCNVFISIRLALTIETIHGAKYLVLYPNLAKILYNWSAPCVVYNFVFISIRLALTIETIHGAKYLVLYPNLVKILYNWSAPCVVYNFREWKQHSSCFGIFLLEMRWWVHVGDAKPSSNI